MRARSRNLALLMLIAAVPLFAAGEPEYLPDPVIVEARYEAPAAGVYVAGEPSVGGYYFDCLAAQGCAIIERPIGAAAVEFEIIDDAGTEVLGLPGGANEHTFCTQTDEAIRGLGGSELLVHVAAGACADGTPSLPTGGTIRATFWIRDRSRR